MKIGLLLSLFIILSGLAVHSQIVYTDPEIPTPDEAVTVFFNATGTPFENFTGDIYAHTGVTVNGSQWQYVIAGWSQNIDKAKLVKISANLYKLEITPTIRQFYGVPSSDIISQICIVFRSSDGGTQTSPDIFIDVFSTELSVLIQEPQQSPVIVQVDDSIPFSATSPLADSMFLFVNNLMVKSVAGTDLQDTVIAESFGNNYTDHWIRVVAKNADSVVADSTSYVTVPNPNVAELPVGMQDGINYLDDSTVLLSLYAPLKKFAFALGEFNNWQWNANSLMNRTPDGKRYWIQLNGLTPAEEYAYQYFVDGKVYVGDPYCEKVLDPWNDQYISNFTYPNLKPYPSGWDHGIVSVFQTDQPQYQWQNTSFNPPLVTDLVVYELLIRDFTSQHTFNSLIDTIGYLQRLRINAIELMPVNEFDGNLSWGYNPSFYFAVDKYYGPKNTLKAFVDTCHDRGIAVILDVVYNHACGNSPYVKLYWDNNLNRPAANSPYYNPIPKHDFNVCSDMNHESPDTKAYIGRALRFWIDEFHVDGYRFDLSKGFTQNNTLGNVSQWGHYDQSRIDILNAYADTVWNVNSKAYVILEHFADNDEEKVLSSDGMMLWGNLNCAYNQATMGYASGPCSWDFSWISYKNRGWNDPHVMGYMESHDEERLMAKNLYYGNSSGLYDIQDTTIALQRMQEAGAFFFTIPGPKMFYEFGELGYDYWINYPGEIGGGDHRTDQKPIRWDYASDYRRKTVYNVWSSLINLRKSEDAFRTTDFNMSVSGSMKKMHLNNNAMNVTVIGNFDVVSGDIDPAFQHTGTWFDYFSGDSITVEDVNNNIALDHGEFKIYTDKKLETPHIGLGINKDYSGSQTVFVYPNPSTDEFNFDLTLAQNSRVVVNIYDVTGTKIKTLIDKKMTPGEYLLKWNGSTDTGIQAHSGIYICEVRINGRREIHKLSLY